MASAAELEQERRRLSALIRGGRKDLNRAKRRADVEARAWVLPARVRHVAIALFHLADLHAEPVVKYLTARGLEYHWPARAADELSTFVQDLYLGATHGEIAGLTDANAPVDPPALATAFALFNDWDIVRSARRANSLVGAVPTDTMLQQREAFRQAVPEALRPPQLGVASERRARRWTHRLRRQWGGRYGAVPTAEPVDPCELEAKAMLAQPTRR